MIKVIEIKTPNCARCKQFEPEYQKIKSTYTDIEYSELVFGQDPKAMEYANQFAIRSAPTFIIEYTNEFGDIVSECAKPEDLEERIKSLL